MNEVVEGAKNGHYIDSLLDPEQQMGLRDGFREVIYSSSMWRNSERGAEKIAAWLLTYGSPKDGCVGYTLVSERRPGSRKYEIELYMVGVRKDCQGRGHGRKIVQFFVASSPSTLKLYARCYPNSQAMFFLLQEIGFVLVSTTHQGIRELALCRK